MGCDARLADTKNPPFLGNDGNSLGCGVLGCLSIHGGYSGGFSLEMSRLRGITAG